MNPFIPRRHFCIGAAEKGDCHDWIPLGGHLLASDGFTRLTQALQACVTRRILIGETICHKP
ncbi:hypothetical protein [Neisseria shayeganii]|uniref:hypothetical protein n=1 Tax=Neisseria shayeganii TaxID=607712 RepID=UPI0012EA0822|nr:hypothetical protein [Neisseria shayeganii]